MQCTSGHSHRQMVQRHAIGDREHEFDDGSRRGDETRLDRQFDELARQRLSGPKLGFGAKEL